MTISKIIQTYCQRYPDEAGYIQKETAFLQKFSNPCSRSNVAGHVTGSGILIKDEKILLIKHRYIQEWFQPGGHIDDGETPLQAAIRELTEETGWQTRLIGEDLPIDIDIHLIPANPKKHEDKHFHVDFAYLLEPMTQIAPSDAEISGWFDIHLIEAPRLRRVIGKFLKQN